MDLGSGCADEDDEADWSPSTVIDSRSFPLSFSFSFCFAALTLALERMGLISVKLDRSAVCAEQKESCWGNGRADELELLVAS